MNKCFFLFFSFLLDNWEVFLIYFQKYHHSENRVNSHIAFCLSLQFPSWIPPFSSYFSLILGFFRISFLFFCFFKEFLQLARIGIKWSPSTVKEKKKKTKKFYVLKNKVHFSFRLVSCLHFTLGLLFLSFFSIFLKSHLSDMDVLSTKLIIIVYGWQ